MLWFEREPERLRVELDALVEAGLRYEIDEAERDSGRLVIDVIRTLDGADHTFRVVYPQQFPHFPFSVIAPESLRLARHINRYARNLCLLADVQQKWRDTDTAALFLTEQLDLLVFANRNPESAADIEAHDAELVTGHIPYYGDSLLLTIDPELPNGIDRGFLDIAWESTEVSRGELIAFRGAVLAVLDADKNILAETSPELRSRYQHARKFRGRWIRLPEPPKSLVKGAILEEAIALWPELKKPAFSGGPDIVALNVPEQTEYRAEGHAWIPVVRQKFGRGQDSKSAIYACRPDRAEYANVQARNPHLKPLKEKTALVVGLGALGSMIAWQLARAGIGSLRLVDGDVVEIGNTPRWLLGIGAVGRGKANALANYLALSFPYLSIDPEHIHQATIGDVNQKPSCDDALNVSFEEVDLIIDGSAEWCVSDYLSTIALQRQIPFLWATATPGAYGGVVGRTMSDRTMGCWLCFQWALNDGTFPLPPEKEDGLIQPVGCAMPTFTGAAFDLDEISIEGARLAVSTLLREYPDYPKVSWDVGICSLRDSNEAVIPPAWATFPLSRHPRCICNDDSR
ncbi:MAG TPA: ThiF family adenylyltransferase [Rhodothermales bacterium]|nr:ThiF family adenylyltransferase [Rhodothermales bacterium]